MYSAEKQGTNQGKAQAGKGDGEKNIIRPTIVVLCGSTRFMQVFQETNLRETLAGRIVLSVGCDTKSDAMLGLGDETKAMLDELHLRKIDLADEVLVLNVNGYVGESTQREIDYAEQQGKRIRYLTEAQSLANVLKGSPGAQALGLDGETILVTGELDPDEEVKDYWYDIRYPDGKRVHVFRYCTLDVVIEDLGERDIFASELVWYPSEQQVDLSNCWCQDCKEFALTFHRIPYGTPWYQALWYRVGFAYKSLRWWI